MAEEKNYTVEGNIVYADIAKLTDEEVKEVRRFQDFGFEVKYEVYHKATVKKHKEANDRNNGVKKAESLKEKYVTNDGQSDVTYGMLKEVMVNVYDKVDTDTLVGYIDYSEVGYLYYYY